MTKATAYYYKLYRVKRSDGRVTTVSVDPVLVTKACQVMGGHRPVAKCVREAAYAYVEGGEVKSCSRFAQNALRAIVSGRPLPAPRVSLPEVPVATPTAMAPLKPAVASEARQSVDSSHDIQLENTISQPPQAATQPARSPRGISERLSAHWKARYRDAALVRLTHAGPRGTGLCAGDVVVTQANTLARPGSLVFAVIDGAPRLCQLTEDTNQVWWAVRCNPAHPAVKADHGLQILTTVVGFYRELA